MKRYNHLSYDERVKISQLKQSGLLAGQIASAIGRPVCTVYRELKRNEAPPGQYGRIRHIAWQLAAVAVKRDSTRISSSRNLLWNTCRTISGHLSKSPVILSMVKPS
ncbi:MAG: helix-turn-helix domain-containing protein [Alphaproteobacteria bacterium]|nr:helix-turn-helix domain-containing protein [Alphaproteobacteria bacterium]